MPSITRRRVLQTGAAAVAGLALGGCTSDPARPRGEAGTTPSPTRTSTSTPPAAKPPNIIVILADDMGYADLGCWGSEIATPNIDRLARSGVRFTGMHNNPRCTVTRASLLTGLYPTQAGLGFNTGDYGTPAYQGYLNDSCVTIAEALGQAGYRSAIAGKWNVAPWGRPTPSLPQMRGFEFSLCEVGGDALSYFDTSRYLNGRRIGRAKNAPDYYFTGSVTGFSVNCIENFAKDGDPFFLYAAYTAPHFPLQAPDEAIAPYSGKYAQGWDVTWQRRYDAGVAAGVIDPRWPIPRPGPGTTPYDKAGSLQWQQRRMEVYAAQISVMDFGVGRILDTLETLGLTDNTIVMFLSDNGGCSEEVKTDNKHAQDVTRNGLPMIAGNVPTVMPGPSNTFQSYGIDWARVSNTPFRMYKRWTEEGGTSTPFIVSWPGTLPAGGLDSRLLHVMDLMPTCLDAAGGSYPSEFKGKPITPVEGQSFAPIIKNQPGQESWHRDGLLFWEHLGHRAARQGDWKLVSDRPTGGWELFDMQTDRTETDDVTRKNRTLAKELSAAYDDWAIRVGVRTYNDKTGYAPS